MRPPQLKFLTKVCHPNVSEGGHICLDILQNQWSPCLNIGKVILSLISLLNDPNPNSPMRGDIAQMFKNNREKYNALVKAETSKHAMKEKLKPVV